MNYLKRYDNQASGTSVCFVLVIRLELPFSHAFCWSTTNHKSIEFVKTPDRKRVRRESLFLNQSIMPSLPPEVYLIASQNQKFFLFFVAYGMFLAGVYLFHVRTSFWVHQKTLWRLIDLNEKNNPGGGFAYKTEVSTHRTLAEPIFKSGQLGNKVKAAEIGEQAIPESVTPSQAIPESVTPSSPVESFDILNSVADLYFSFQSPYFFMLLTLVSISFYKKKPRKKINQHAS